jgi:MoxR-like ATPase
MGGGAVGVAVDAKGTLQALARQLGTVLRGKEEPLELLLLCCAAGGHVLLEDVPGTGKTTVARALAASLGCDCARIQCTPDLLPADITGSSVFHPREGRFSFRPGPVFTHVLIADELNRASPRTQSALLEALGEGQVSADGESLPLPRPFLCIATLNPVEMHGAFPLPEASLDRFHARISLGYAALEEEVALLCHGPRPPASLEPVVDREGLLALQESVARVHLAPAVAGYLARLVRGTREHPAVRLGVSLRGALQLAGLARARALFRGRGFVLPEDLQALARPALAHRLVLDPRASSGGLDGAEVLGELLQRVEIPR